MLGEDDFQRESVQLKLNGRSFDAVSICQLTSEHDINARQFYLLYLSYQAFHSFFAFFGFALLASSQCNLSVDDG